MHYANINDEFVPNKWVCNANANFVDYVLEKSSSCGCMDGYMQFVIIEVAWSDDINIFQN